MSRLTGAHLLAALVLAAGLAPHADAEEAGVLFVKSEPAGASIWIDGLETRYRTPRIVGNIAPGKHVVLVRLADHTPVRREIEVQAGQVTTVAIDLTGRSGGAATLVIETTPPGATVWIDTVERGTTPVTVTGLKPGAHMIVAMRDGYQLVEREVSVEAGARDTLRLDLAGDDAGGDPADEGDVVLEDDLEPAETTVEAEHEDVPKKIDVNCPYCKGGGVIKSMGCYRCARTGLALLDDCPSCTGNGEIDTECRACAGRGNVISNGKEYPCRSCKGKGYPTCTACRGKGSVEKPNPEATNKPTKRCAMCKGSGFEQKMRCAFCKGVGRLESLPGLARRGRVRRAAVRPQCPLCGGDGLGPPVCRRCKGRGSFGVGANAKMCQGCMGTGHTHAACKGCRGRGFVYTQ